VRLWSLHPQFLDPAGLVALWREALLAQAVLAGRTRGYTKHPQLTRFREHDRPEQFLAAYLREIANEAGRRGYHFDVSKIPPRRRVRQGMVTSGQLEYELEHLKRKLRARNAEWYRRVRRVREPLPHPSFVVVSGPIAEWETVRTS
jgi:hypothetical protein